MEMTDLQQVYRWLGKQNFHFYIRFLYWISVAKSYWHINFCLRHLFT